MKTTIQKLLWGALLAGCCGLAFGEALSDTPVAVDIARQPLRDALAQFSRQTGLQVMLREESVPAERQIARTVKGTLSPREALAQLLEKTNLQYEFVTDSMVRISAVPAREQARARHADSSPMRLAEVHPAVQRAGDSRATDGAQDRAPSKPERALTDSDAKGTPEMLVKGSRTFNTDIRRTEDDVQPYVVYDAQTISRSMATNLEDFLKSRLPMNMVHSNNSQQVELAGNTSSIDLRGLGTDETLILVNGRRLPGVSEINRGGAIGQADINGIPLSAVERIEVLPATASGIYGGGATGGVVNIILKSDFNAFDVGATYENTFDTDSGTRRLDFSAGFNLEGGKTNILLTGSYSDGNSMTVGDRDFVQRGYRLYLENTGNDFSGNFSPPLGSTTNIINLFDFGFPSQLRLLDPNGGPSIPLGEQITHVPVGYTGVQSDGGAALIANAGSYNIELPRDIQGLGGGLVNSPTVSSAGASIRREFTPRIEGFLDLSLTRNDGHVLDASQTTSLELFPGQPGNPFDNVVSVVFPLPGLAFDRTFESENLIANAGAIMRLPRDWLGQVEYSWGRSRTASAQTSPIIGPAGRAAIFSGELDIFSDLNLFTPDYAGNGYLLDSPNNITGPFDNTREGATLRFAGPAYDLPGGPLALSVFLEQRETAADGAFTLQQSSTGAYQRHYYADRSGNVNSVSLEANIPLISDRNARPAIRSLDLQAAVRYDDYRINGVETGFVNVDEGDPIPELDRVKVNLNSADYTVGLRYAPAQDIAVRASFGTGFLPPSVAQIMPLVQTDTMPFINDPERNFARITLPTSIAGGNPNLRPEESESLSMGAIITPRFLPGLRLSVDYTEILKSDQIAGVSAQDIVSDPGLYPAGRVVRAELTPQDEMLGYSAGAITLIDASLINFSRATVRAFDVQLDYDIDTALGSLRVYALATHLKNFSSQFSAVTPVIDNAGHLARLKWRGNAGLTLQRDLWSIDWNMQYYHGYLIYSASLPEAAIPGAILEQGSPGIPRQTYHDMVVRLRLGEAFGAGVGILANTDLQLGIKNVFNTSPPILATAFPSNGYSFFGDPRLRRYSISFNKRFGL